MHVVPLLPVVTQSKQLPDEPHAVFWLPPTHVPPEQQKPPAHVPSPGAPHATVQAPAAQVGVPFEHATQAAPVAPHAVLTTPVWQRLLPPQQPPLHAEWFAPPQALSQT